MFRRGDAVRAVVYDYSAGRHNYAVTTAMLARPQRARYTARRVRNAKPVLRYAVACARTALTAVDFEHGLQMYRPMQLERRCNAEQSLRTSPNVTTLCVYDLQTGVNLSEDDQSVYREVAKCPLPVSPAATPKSAAAADAAPASPSPSPSTTSVPSPTPSPSTSTQSAVKATKTPSPKPKTVNKSPADETKKETTTTATATATATTTTATTAPATTTSSTSTATPTETADPAATQAQALPDTIAAVAETQTPTPSNPPNEGCIAVEHLRGAALQYRRHLTRNVLCTRGVCATPHHALIVDGVWTSLRALCALPGAACTARTALVNNLRIASNTRHAVAPGVVATPYDVRFPCAASFVAQAALELCYLLDDLLAAPQAFVAGAAALALAALVARGAKRSSTL